MGVTRRQAGLVAGCVLATLLPAAAVLPASDARPATAAAAFPGSNGLIAFVSDRDGNDDLYVMRPDGTGVEQLTDTDEIESAPAWSPDGTRLVFTRQDAGDRILFVIDADGTDERQLTEGGNDDLNGAWSPDGTRIVFESDRGDQSSRIFVVPADGGEEQVLIDPEQGGAYDPAWSPDGRRIAFSAYDDTAEQFLIWTARADGSGLRPLTDPTDGDQGMPDWSPDGDRIVFRSSGDGESYVYTAAGDGSDEPVRLTPEGEDTDTAPAWSPDGDSIVFQREVVEGTDEAETIARMTDTGEDREQITGGGLDDDVEPAWGAAPPVATVVVEPASADRVLGEEHAVRVTATDGIGRPVAGAELALRVTGAHPRAVLLVTDADGEADYSWVGNVEGADTVLVCDDPDADRSCDPAAPADTATVLWTDPDRPRLAFTDDTDALYTIPVDRGLRPSGTPFYVQADGASSYGTERERYQGGPTHEGEAAGVPGRRPAFVSTLEESDGEVYEVQSEGDPLRITCAPGSESHPVVSTNGWIAYASDADGDWDIYVSRERVVVPGRPPPFGASPPRAVSRRDVPRVAAQACDEDWETRNVTDEVAGAPVTDELWPTWTYGVARVDGALQLSGLVFSRAAAGELPDLWRVGGGFPSFSTPSPLTTTPATAETQPAAMTQRVEIAPPPDCEGICRTTYAGRTWVAFATSDRRSSGTIGLLSPDEPAPRRVVRPASDGFGGIEPAWDDLVNPQNLAVTTSEDDPYGDIAIAAVSPPTRVGDLPGDPVVREFAVVDHGPTGTGVSHPFWAAPFGRANRAVLVVTARAGTEVEFPARVLDADISDVYAPDGTQRRVVLRDYEVDGEGALDFRYDEAGPSYSPDGRQIVYSRDVPGDASPGARELMTASADGASPRRLLRSTQRSPDDVDVDPVWSPDGRRIAFVRITGRNRTGDPPLPPDPPQVWVYDRDTEAARPVPLGDGRALGDLSPSWAPDSRHLALARRSAAAGAPADGARRWGTGSPGGPSTLVLVDTEGLEPPVPVQWCFEGCQPVTARSPSWSPDGTRVAYDHDGELETVAVPSDCCAGWDGQTAAPTTLVGTEVFFGEATDSRSVVQRAQDPAWSPDGSEIAFTGQPVGQPDRTGIWRIDADGSDVRVFTDEPGPESEPAWQDRREADVQVTVVVTDSPAMIDEPVTATFTVTNLGPRAAPLVSLDTSFSAGAATTAPGAPAGCRTDGTGCDFAELAPGASVVYPVRIRHGERVLGVASGSVESESTDPDLTNNTDSDDYRVMGADVAVDIALDAPVGYVGGHRTATVTVRNVGVDPVDAVEVRATWTTLVVPGEPEPLPPPAPPPAPPCLVAGVACPLGTLDPGARRAFRVDLLTGIEGATELVAEVSTTTMQVDLTNDEDVVALEVLKPALRVLPSVTPPGKVVLAYGEQFPPGSQVTLRWSSGINVVRGSTRVAPDGTLRVPVLVVRRDVLGTRALVARSRTRLFSKVGAELLVVPRTVSPPSFKGRG